MAARFARRVALTFPLTSGDFPAERPVLTGNPLRPELAGGSREAGCRLLGFDPAQPVVYFTGGSQGSHKLNRTPGAVLAPMLEHTQLVHQCGDHPTTGDRAWLEAAAAQLPAALTRRYALRPYIGAELRDIFAAAELVVGRSGAGTVNECCQLDARALYVPLPGTSGDEQTANARPGRGGGRRRALAADLAHAGAAPGGRDAPSRRPAELARMGERARALAVPGTPPTRIARLVLEAAGA